MTILDVAERVEHALSTLVRYHEAHITLDAKDREVAERQGKLHGFKWSQIEGDEVMGPGTRGYLTRSSGYKMLLATALFQLCDDLAKAGVMWERRKIEAIVFDERRVKAT